MNLIRFPGLHTILLLLSLNMAGITQPVDSAMLPPKSYLASYWHTGITLLVSPTHWTGDDWAKLGGTIAITGAIMSMDEAISQPFFNWQNDFGNAFGKTGNVVGDISFQFGLTGATLAAGAISRSKPLQHFALDNLQAQVYTGGLTWLAKKISHRARPASGESAYTWQGPLEWNGDEFESFFSMHSSLSYCTATMIFLHSKRKWWVGLLSYTLATGVSLSRMQQGEHWASDIIIGAVIGSAVAGFVYKQQEKRRNPGRKLVIIP